AVLRRMGRHWYTAESYEEAVICLLPAAAPFALSADIITGFPGETPADHAATMAMLERLPFTSLHVFPYSPRPGTPALNLKDAVPVSTAKGRAEEMRVLAADKGARYAAGRLGGKCDVVVTDRGKGLTEDYLAVRISDPSLPRRSRFSARLAMDEGRLTAVPEQLLPP
ncbi:MAG TPA: hypothetical protein VHM24_12675, partial [Gemmatimonadaceae bacterium]|nr:hypothetical protein [Gemmatimonadaceae bacterium]